MNKYQKDKINKNLGDFESSLGTIMAFHKAKVPSFHVKLELE